MCTYRGALAFLMALVLPSLYSTVQAQDGLKVSGYWQLYYQLGERDAKLSVGDKRESSTDSYARLGIRRGRTKLSYSKGKATGVLQLDFTEHGVELKDAYLRLALPALGGSSLQAGVFDRPFGHEISYSSSRRESPERALITTTLFPNERDLGFMLTLTGGKGSAWNKLRLDAGLFAGQGIKRDVDSRLDFIGRLSTEHRLSDNWYLGGGASWYYGAVYQTTPELYRIHGGSWSLDNRADNVGQYATRSYLGLDMQLRWTSPLGQTQLRGEWIWGQQPGSSTSSKSPNGSLQTSAMYLRPFSGGYAVLSHSLGRSPLSLFAKYDWYDPNTVLAGDAIGTSFSSEADLAYQTLGLGALYQVTQAIRVTLYGELVYNEKTQQIERFAQDRRDNRLTLALQYKF